ncbi:uncharacterized protein L203_102852 [Cryptococcus depauperatus CBS 7841]|uniref:Uncharacterized protein n=1 Tax=Cryptococcus depauperatus CBS 7841 TaxID=1295531 RepID=A0A1E3ICY6_9TREE|nr:hypothetical protein L203_04654 [Cryptococcus depauperatus CBS 7841]
MVAIAEYRAFFNSVLDNQAERRKFFAPNHTFPAQPAILGRASKEGSKSTQEPSEKIQSRRTSEEEQPSKENVVNYVKDEETVRNDYCEWYNHSGEYGSNFIMGAKDDEICAEYPALRKLMDLKSQQVSNHTHPPLYAQLQNTQPLRQNLLSLAGACKFDVIRINPHAGWSEVADLPIKQLSADPAIVFLWVGRGDDEGLERGRECFARWGFRRAEDIVWVKTNKGRKEGAATGALFASQKEHCLMGIRGTIKRSVDVRFAHCNVDTDVIVWEHSEDPGGPRLPPYLYTLIENFCLGTRRLEIFGRPSLARQGWVTVGFESLLTTPNLEPENKQSHVQPFDSATYLTQVLESDGKPILPFHQEIDQLRPKSPQRRVSRLPPGSGPGQNHINSAIINNRPPAPRHQNLNRAHYVGMMGPRGFMQGPQFVHQQHTNYGGVPSTEQPMAALRGQALPTSMNLCMPMGIGIAQYGLSPSISGPGINGGQPGFVPYHDMGMSMSLNMGQYGMNMNMGLGMPLGIEAPMGTRYTATDMRFDGTMQDQTGQRSSFQQHRFHSSAGSRFQGNNY